MIRKTKKIIKYGLIAAAHPGNAKRALSLANEKRKMNAKRRSQYIRWFSQHQPSQSELENQRAVSKKLKHRPLISILLPTYNTPPKLLAECIDSILSQTYNNWELCISDDASPSEETKALIKKYVKEHKNIKAIFNKTNGHIAAATNVAMTLAKGEYISLMDHDDMLLPDALYETVKVINEHPDADLIYSDEDKLEDDKWHIEPFFKPDWSPDFLLSCNVITHFATIRHDLMKKVGGFRAGTEGAQDWDLFLRLTELTDNIYHIPKIIYSWRKTPNSTASTYKNKNYAYINQKKVIRDAMARRNIAAAIDGHKYMGFWRVRYQIQGAPLVSIVIPSKNHLTDVKRCLESVFEKTSYPNFEVILIDTGTKDKKVWDFYEQLGRGIENFKLIKWSSKGGFNFAAACNAGAKAAKGDYLVFLNNDTEVMDAHWLRDLLEHAQRDSVGAVGGKLLFADNKIQHAGIVLSKRDVAFHPFYGLDEHVDIFSNIYINNIRDVAAVTGACLMVSKTKFNKVGGFDEKLAVTYNDVDLCLKLLKAGYLNVYTPYACLHHYESKSVGKIMTAERDHKEWRQAFELMQSRWGDLLANDPYYNPNFVQHGPGYQLEG